MKKKQKVDLVIALFLILMGSVLLVLPLFSFMKIKLVFNTVLILYALLNIIQFAITKEDKDYEGLFTFGASIITLLVAYKLDITARPWNLAVSLFIWVILMALIKLKKSDYYNDRKDKVWILRIVTLLLFILVGLLSIVNLYYTADIQILVLGFFFLIHGILELVDPISNYLIYSKK